MDRILNMYKDTNVPVSEFDITSLINVDIDNVCYRLNKTFGGFFSYDTEIITTTVYLLKVTIYTPIKAITGYAKIDMNNYDMDVLTRTAMVNACMMGFDFREETIAPTNLSNLVANDQKFDNDKRDVAATTLEDLEAIEKEIAASIHNEDTEIKVKDKGLVEFKPDPPNTTSNPFGIRDDQIEFMKKFQEEYHIDTTEKFDTYVTAWGHQQSMYVIDTKKQLIGSGPQAVDAFIAWVKEVNGDNAEFIEPTDEECRNC